MFEDKYEIWLGILENIGSQEKITTYSELLFYNYQESNLYSILETISKMYKGKYVTFDFANNDLDKKTILLPKVDGLPLPAEDIRLTYQKYKSAKILKDQMITRIYFTEIFKLGKKDTPIEKVNLLVSKVRELNKDTLDPYLKGLYHQMLKHALIYCPCGCGNKKLVVTSSIITDKRFVPYIKEMINNDVRETLLIDVYQFDGKSH